MLDVGTIPSPNFRAILLRERPETELTTSCAARRDFSLNDWEYNSTASSNVIWQLVHASWFSGQSCLH